MNCRQLFVAGFTALTLAGGCASLQLPKSAAGDPKVPGTPAWWKKHKKNAEMVPGMGHRVDGVEGYFDDNGVPINSRVAKVVEKRDDGAGGLLNDASTKQFVGGIKERMGLGPNQQEAQRQFDLGEANFRGQRFDDAAENFKAAANGWPDSALAQDALFALAESYFFGDRYPKANNAYEDMLKKYPNSRHLDKAITRQFAIARYWEQYSDYDPDWPVTPNVVNKRLPLFDTLGRSLKTYENIRLNDPTGPLADDAIMATANSYFRRGRFNDADYQYDLLRKEYPRSDHQFNAHELGLQCKLRRYQGPDYDGTPLIEAQKLVKQHKAQFLAELTPEQRQRLVTIDAQVERELANREFAMAKHFDNIEEYGAAKFYYGQVLKEYPTSEFGEQARQRLAALGGLPDRPEPKLAWLIDYVPESSERRAVKQVPLLENNSLEPPGSNGPMLATPQQEGT
ncbi:MAG TPA: tetratricopeptide repeat protein, partial [Lacipirellulaceae bacterium]|nr:tetratricopeptide repeat protein [Lacipirellulaceae bacterium]